MPSQVGARKIFGGGAKYKPLFAGFDGIGDYLSRADYAGSADVAKCLIGISVMHDGGDGTTQTYYSNLNARVSFYRTIAANAVRFYLISSASTAITRIEAIGMPVAAGVPHQIICAFDASAAANRQHQIMIDGQFPSQTVVTDIQGTYDFTRTSQWVGAGASGAAGGNPLFAAINDFFLFQNACLDLTQVIERFWKNGKPVDPGNACEKIFNDGTTVPIAFHSIRPGETDPTLFARNLGTGGVSSIVGGLDLRNNPFF